MEYGRSAGSYRRHNGRGTKMNVRSVKGAIAVALMLALMSLAMPALTGCTVPSSTSPTAPVVAPVNTNPEPTETTDFSQNATEESESVHATGTP
jgi:hypothetical protein